MNNYLATSFRKRNTLIYEKHEKLSYGIIAASFDRILYLPLRS